MAVSMPRAILGLIMLGCFNVALLAAGVTALYRSSDAHTVADATCTSLLHSTLDANVVRALNIEGWTAAFHARLAAAQLSHGQARKDNLEAARAYRHVVQGYTFLPRPDCVSPDDARWRQPPARPTLPKVPAS